MSEEDAVAIKNSLISAANNANLDYTTSNYILDGGNVVDNYVDSAIITTRFFDDNGINKNDATAVENARQELVKATGYKNIALIEPDEPVLAHSDGQAMFVGKDKIIINDYSEYDPDLRASILQEFSAQMPSKKIIEVEVEFDDRKFTGKYNSACGIYINSVYTYKYIYMPTYNNPTKDEQMAKKIEEESGLKVIKVPAQNVCIMGGSCRCLTWQLVGDNAKKLIEVARK